MSALEREPRSLTIFGTVIDRCTADPNAVQRLSLSAKSSGVGVLSGVTFVQRVNTVARRRRPEGPSSATRSACPTRPN